MQDTTQLTITGLRSGNTYTFTVDYVRDGSMLIILCDVDAVWWKNLLYGASVAVELDGEAINAYARTYTNACDVARRLNVFLQKRPALASVYGVKPRRNGRFRRRDLLEAAQQFVAVEVQVAPQLALI